MLDYKQLIASKIKAPLSTAELMSLVTETSDDSFGDYAFPCFKLAKLMRMSPVAIAEKLAADIELDDHIVKVQAVNGYLNFFVNRLELTWEVISDVFASHGEYGNSDMGSGKTV